MGALLQRQGPRGAHGGVTLLPPDGGLHLLGRGSLFCTGLGRILPSSGIGSSRRRAGARCSLPWGCRPVTPVTPRLAASSPAAQRGSPGPNSRPPGGADAASWGASPWFPELHPTTLQQDSRFPHVSRGQAVLPERQGARSSPTDTCFQDGLFGGSLAGSVGGACHFGSRGL